MFGVAIGEARAHHATPLAGNNQIVGIAAARAWAPVQITSGFNAAEAPAVARCSRCRRGRGRVPAVTCACTVRRIGPRLPPWGLDARCWRQLIVGGLTTARPARTRSTSTRVPGLVNLEWERRLVAAGQLGKGLRVSIDLDEVLFTESNHAESTNCNRRLLGGLTSAFVADHARAPKPSRSQAHESTVRAR